MNCPAVIQIRGIKIFSQACYEIKQSDHATENSLKMAKKKALQRLKDDMFRTTANVPTMTRYYVKLPFCSEHHGHPIGASATINHCVDRRIIRKIDDLVQKGVTRPDEVKRCLDEFVEREVFADVAPQDRPKRSGRKYYPTRQDLRNHITKAIAASKYCKDDQESLLEKVREWQTDGPRNFFYRPKGKENDRGEKFLFVHQEVWQQRLLGRYGSELVLLDATYKMTKYALPLFFLCVHTNVGYKVVAEFICENEDAESVAEALHVIQGWNTEWDPLFFMVDYSTAQINAIEREFPKADVYICDFHRNQAWHRWIRSGKSGLDSNKQNILMAMLQRVATARDVAQYDAAVAKLRNSQIYKAHKNVRDYLENVWMSCVSRWAQAFRKQQVLNIVNTNNGVEAQNKHFKYNYLPRSVDKSVFGIAVLLVESFIPDAYQHYVDTNFKQSSAYRSYNRDLPSYLHNRPAHFIKHCMKSKFSAEEFRDIDVDCLDLARGHFRVRSQGSLKLEYMVQLQVPSCTCESWLKTHFPCKHFFAVFNAYEEWDFSRLPDSYLSNVFITLDCIGFGVTKDTNEEEMKRPNEDDDDDDADFHPEVIEPQRPSQRVRSSQQCPVSDLKRLRQAVIERASLVRDAAYNVDDTECLGDALETLKRVHAALVAKSRGQEGLPVRASPARKRLKVTSMDYHKVFHKGLPLRRGRRKAKVRKNFTYVDLTSSPEPSTNKVRMCLSEYEVQRYSKLAEYGGAKCVSCRFYACLLFHYCRPLLMKNQCPLGTVTSPHPLKKSLQTLVKTGQSFCCMYYNRSSTYRADILSSRSVVIALLVK